VSAGGEGRVKACVFDAYGTLLDVMSAVAPLLGELGPDATALGLLWRRKQLEYSWLRSLMQSHRDFWAITGDSLDYALEATGLQGRVDRERLLLGYRSLQAHPEVGAVLERLRGAGLATAILSNGEPAMLRDAAVSAGIDGLLAHILSIEEAGVYKPAAETYMLATLRLGLPAHEIAFVSSNGWDAHGAAWFGFRVYWANRASAPRARLPGDLGAVMADLRALPDLLLT
jgi:2-haloacid dehalogenase